MKPNKHILLTVLILFACFWVEAQTAGINYQALILDEETLEIPGTNIGNSQAPLANEEVNFRFTISRGPNTNFEQLYMEEQLTETDQNGLISLIVGEGTALFSSFTSINWDGTPKYLNVEIDIIKNGEGFVFLDSQKILFLPQANLGIQTITADNGLSVNNGTLVLGGALNQPTTITTTNTNSLAITGLEPGNLAEDDFVVIDRQSGRLKRWQSTNLIQTEEKKIIAIDGQTRFIPPFPISNPNKINVYRNGVKIDFTVIDANTLELESGVVCYQDDEIRIVQIN